jgi:hypothetical protein
MIIMLFFKNLGVRLDECHGSLLLKWGHRISLTVMNNWWNDNWQVKIEVLGEQFW